MTDTPPEESRALVHGALMGTLMAMRESGPLRITGIDQTADPAGNYRPYMDLTLASGNVIRVTVTAVPSEEIVIEQVTLASGDIERRLRADMAMTLRDSAIVPEPTMLLDRLVEDAMHQITQLLIARNVRDREDYLS